MWERISFMVHWGEIALQKCRKMSWRKMKLTWHVFLWRWLQSLTRHPRDHCLRKRKSSSSLRKAIDSESSRSPMVVEASPSSKPRIDQSSQSPPAFGVMSLTMEALWSTGFPSTPSDTFLSFMHSGLWKHPERCEKQLFRLMLICPGSTVVWAGFKQIQLPQRWLKCHCLLMKPSFCCLVIL